MSAPAPSSPVPLSARLARLVNPLVWRLPHRAPRLLLSFARAEASSMLDLRAAAAACPEPRRRALYLRHALDEERHAEAFSRHAQRLLEADGRALPGPVDGRGDGLYARLGEVSFLAFVHLGERRGRAQFEAHRDHFAARGHAREAALFTAILADERRHEAYTKELLVELTGSEAAAARALRRATLWEAGQRWRRAGGALSARLYVVVTGALYLACLPLALALRARRAPPPGFSPLLLDDEAPRPEGR